MNVRGSQLLLLAVGVLVTAFAFGPVAPGLALSSPPEQYEPATGSVDVTVTSTPDSLALERNSFGSDTYQLNASTVQTAVSNVSGNPLVVYDLRVPALEYNKETYQILSPDSPEALTIRATSDTIQPYEVDQRSFDATVTVLVRSDEGTRIVATKNVTVHVTE